NHGMNLIRIAALQASLCIVLLGCSRASRESANEIRKSEHTSILVSSSADGTLESIVQALRAASNLGAISASDIEGTAADLRRSPRKMDDENANLLSESVVNSFAVPIGIEDADYLEVARLLATNAYAKGHITGIGIASRGNTDTAV